MAQAFAHQLALIAFATAAIHAVISGAALSESLQSALVGMLAFYGLGWILGELARRVVEESVDAQLAGMTLATETQTKSQ